MSRGGVRRRSRRTSWRACARSASAGRAPAAALSPSDYKITGIEATFEGDEHSADRRPLSAVPAFRFVGGKGGVGKTTCAAAHGLSRRARRPAHARHLHRSGALARRRARQPLGAVAAAGPRRQPSPRRRDRRRRRAGALARGPARAARGDRAARHLARSRRRRAAAAAVAAGDRRARRAARDRRLRRQRPLRPHRRRHRADRAHAAHAGHAGSRSRGLAEVFDRMQAKHGSWSRRCAAAGRRMPRTR